MLVSHKLRLNFAPPTPLSSYFDTPEYLCVCLKTPVGCVCVGEWLFFHHASEGKYKCELCERYICWGVKYYFAIFPPPPPCQSSSLPRSFTLTLSHPVFLLYGSEKWSWWLTFQPVEHQKMNDYSDWIIFISFFLFLFSLCLLILFSVLLFSLSISLSFSHIILSQKADVGVEEVSGCVQPRGTVWAHPPNAQSPRVHLQVHCTLAHALLPVSVFVSFMDWSFWYWLLIFFGTHNNANRDSSRLAHTHTQPSDTALLE